MGKSKKSSRKERVANGKNCLNSIVNIKENLLNSRFSEE